MPFVISQPYFLYIGCIILYIIGILSLLKGESLSSISRWISLSPQDAFSCLTYANPIFWACAWPILATINLVSGIFGLIALWISVEYVLISQK